jgi:hypothetical protein
MPNQDDLAILEEIGFQKDLDKVIACQQLLKEAISRERALRVVVLKKRLAKFEAQRAGKRAKQLARRARLLTSQVKAADELTGSKNSLGALSVIDRLEKKIEANELLAKGVWETIANLGPGKIETMSVEVLKEVLETIALAREELANNDTALSDMESLLKQGILTIADAAKDWQARQQTPENQGYPELVEQAGTIAGDYLDVIVELEKAIDMLGASSESIRQRLERLDAASSKIAARLKEIERD